MEEAWPQRRVEEVHGMIGNDFTMEMVETKGDGTESPVLCRPWKRWFSWRGGQSPIAIWGFMDITNIQNKEDEEIDILVCIKAEQSIVAGKPLSWNGLWATKSNSAECNKNFYLI